MEIDLALAPFLPIRGFLDSDVQQIFLQLSTIWILMVNKVNHEMPTK